MAKFSKLLGKNAEDVAPATARQTFFDEVQRIFTEGGQKDYSAAWEKAKTLHPECYDRMCQKTEGEHVQDLTQSPVLANALTGPDHSGVKAHVAPQMHLPPDCSDTEFNIVWNANGRTVHPLNAGKIVTALVAYYLGQGQSKDVARDTVAKRFPVLWKSAGQGPT
jgi:hypothetical protein